MNTVHWRLAPERRLDSVVEYSDVVRWATQLGSLAPAEADALSERAHGDPLRAASVADEVRSLRESIYAALYEGADPGPILDAYRDAIAHGTLAPSPGTWEWVFPVDLALPLRRAALDAIELMTGERRELLTRCQDADCGWVFLDTSPRHNRRWCVSADCGNRNRVREFYNRGRRRSVDKIYRPVYF